MGQRTRDLHPLFRTPTEACYPEVRARKGVVIVSSEDQLNRREFLRRVLGMGGAGLALMFVAACGGEGEDEDEGDDD